MSKTVDKLQTLSAAEEFLDVLAVDYVPEIVHVNRLHILKRFQQYLQRDPVPDGLSDELEYGAYRERLQRAYLDFVESSPLAEKVFKVFQDAHGIRNIPLESVRASLKRPAT